MLALQVNLMPSHTMLHEKQCQHVDQGTALVELNKRPHRLSGLLRTEIASSVSKLCITSDSEHDTEMEKPAVIKFSIADMEAVRKDWKGDEKKNAHNLAKKKA